MPGAGAQARDPRPPDAVRALGRRVAAAGGRAYLVGGCVRDPQLGIAAKDWDVEVFGLAVDPLAALLGESGKVNAVGRSFGVLKWRTRGVDGEVDVSIPRRDSKVGPGHKGIAVEGDPGMTLEEATRRRDLTVNALLWDLVDERLVDLHDGLGDLARGLLRAVDASTFLEDPLRALRVAQFAARFGFRADDDLIALCRRASLDELPAERIFGEWEKLLLKGTHVAHAFALARAADLPRRVFPEVADLDTGAVVDRTPADGAPVGRALALRLAAWLHPARPEAIAATLDRLHLHRYGGYRVREQVHALCAHHRDPIGTDAELRWLATRCEPELALALRTAATGEDTGRARARVGALGIGEAPPPALLLGRHLQALGVGPGPRMGDLVKEAFRRQLDGELVDEAGALAWARARVAEPG